MFRASANAACAAIPACDSGFERVADGVAGLDGLVPCTEIPATSPDFTIALTQMNHAEATAFCKQRGRSLVVPESFEDIEHCKFLLSVVGTPGVDNMSVWLGISSDGSSGFTRDDG